MPMDNETLARTYTVSDLEKEIGHHRINQTILVQAAPTVNETEYLLGIADTAPLVAGVVGWIDFEDKGDLKTLERLAKHPKFVGVRPMIQDIPDDDWMLRDDIQWAYKAVTDLGLTFDALGYPRHMENFLRLFQMHPDMNVVVDHCLKPEISKHGFSTEPGDKLYQRWQDGIARIAADTSACCKISGLVTEAADRGWGSDVPRYIEHVLARFGPERVMWGSDWPVCLQKSEYSQWLEHAQDVVRLATKDEMNGHYDLYDQRRIFGGTATEFYSLPALESPAEIIL